MTKTNIKPNLANSDCPTVDFPRKIKNRNLSIILKKVREGETSEYTLAEGMKYAAKEGHVNALKYLITQGADLNYWGESVFRNAVEKGHLGFVQYLAEQGVSYCMETALVMAAREGYLDILKFLIGEYNCKEDDYDEAFIQAIVHGHLDTVKYFVSNKLIDVPAYDGNPIAIACWKGHLEVIEYLVEEGADLHKDEELALCYAAEEGHFLVIKYLLEHGADIHAQNEKALYEALENGHLLVAIFLLQHGANLRHENIQELLKDVGHKHPEFQYFSQALQLYMQTSIPKP